MEDKYKLYFSTRTHFNLQQCKRPVCMYYIYAKVKLMSPGYLQQMPLSLLTLPGYVILPHWIMYMLFTLTRFTESFLWLHD